MQQQQQQKVTDRRRFRFAARVAYTTAVLFVVSNVLVVLLFMLGRTQVAGLVIGISNIITQLLILSIVALVPCPSWARACGYGARFILIVGPILWLNGVSTLLTTPLQLSGAAIGTIWLITVSWQIKGTTRVIGILLASLYIVFSLHVEWNQGPPSYISLLLYFVWLLLIARAFHNYGKPEPAVPKQDSSWHEWYSVE